MAEILILAEFANAASKLAAKAKKEGVTGIEVTQVFTAILAKHFPATEKETAK